MQDNSNDTVAFPEPEKFRPEQFLRDGAFAVDPAHDPHDWVFGFGRRYARAAPSLRAGRSGRTLTLDGQDVSRAAPRGRRTVHHVRVDPARVRDLTRARRARGAGQAGGEVHDASAYIVGVAWLVKGWRDLLTTLQASGEV